MDLPWDSSQVDVYGASFKAWEEKDFARAWNAIRKALPHNLLTCVVQFMSVFCMQKYSEAFLYTIGCLGKGFFVISFACKNASEYFCMCKSILRHFCIQMIGF
jgi:hypothetical protein